jgi:glycine cleavage system H lipoate-binding protein
MFKIKPSNLAADIAGLMDAAAYKEFIESL